MKNRLKEVRVAKSVTQEEIANHIGVSRAYICRVENETKDISLSLASEIADYLEVSLDEIAGRTINIEENETPA